MADCAQATLRGGEMVVECDDRWNCCQRAQARAKVNAMNSAILQHRNATIQPPGFSRARGDAWCDSQRRRIDKLDSQGQADDARASGAPECLAKQLEGPPAQTRASLNLALDHPLDMKLGGPAMPRLMPLDPDVNGAFGSFARNVGDKRGTGKKIEKVSLICPPSGNCPNEDHSTKDAQGQPPNPIGMFEWTTTYTFTP